MAEATIEPRVTQTGAISPVAAAVVRTVAFLFALFAVKPLWTPILTELSADPWWTFAASTHRITASSVFALADEGAVSTKMSLGASLVAEDPSPAVRTVTAVFL